MPYESAADAVEFWREVDELFGIDRPLCPNQNTIVDWPPNEQGYSVESYTRDRLTRCVLWLAEQGRSVAMRSCGGFYFPIHSGYDAFQTDDTCIITAHRDAIIAVAREAK